VKSGSWDGSSFVPFIPDEAFPDPFDIITGAGGEIIQIAPENFGLSQNYPNPFNPTTAIGYQLPKASYVNLAVYDVSGRKVFELAEGLRAAGVHEVTFDAVNFASGLYFYRLEAGDFKAVRKMVLIK
jgi:hypothetical protein